VSPIRHGSVQFAVAWTVALTLSVLARERGVADVIELLVNNRSPIASGAPAAQQRLRTISSENADVFLNDGL
jgi:hypothetical protein